MIIKFNKKGLEKVTLIILLLTLAAIIVMTAFAIKFNSYATDEANIAKCRLSMIANSKIRSGTWSLGDAAKERIPINCPMRPDLIIKRSDIEASSPAAMKYNIMRKIADEQVITHYKTAADLNISSLSEEDGIYCIIDRKISFDKSIKQDNELKLIENYWSYLINTKKTKSKQYYSEYLYGFRKSTDAKEEFNGIIKKMIESSEDSKIRANIGKVDFNKNIDLTIDPQRDYYTMHMIIKGKSFVSKSLEVAPGVGATAGFCYIAVDATLLLLAPEVTVTKVLGIVAGIAALGCAVSGAYTYSGYGNDAYYRRMTLLVPVDKFNDLGCTETYK